MLWRSGPSSPSTKPRASTASPRRSCWACASRTSTSCARRWRPCSTATSRRSGRQGGGPSSRTPFPRSATT
eukprot:2166962-Alexandrium_andersonii.AAC.1